MNTYAWAILDWKIRNNNCDCRQAWRLWHYLGWVMVTLVVNLWWCGAFGNRFGHIFCIILCNKLKYILIRRADRNWYLLNMLYTIIFKSSNSKIDESLSFFSNLLFSSLRPRSDPVVECYIRKKIDKVYYYINFRRKKTICRQVFFWFKLIMGAGRMAFYILHFGQKWSVFDS